MRIFGLLLTAVMPLLAQTDVPPRLAPPAGQQLLWKVRGMGSQIYVCKGAASGLYAWTLQAPEAQLVGEKGEVVGRHFAGPSWQARDGSQVLGKVVASVPAPQADSIPWLLLTVISASGEGSLAGVESVQRLHTQGGKAPAEGCDRARAGAERRVDYQAEYLFFGRRK